MKRGSTSRCGLSCRDVCRLSAGDLVPTDARLIESRDLSVQQSMLTGESLPADKMVSGAGHDGPTGPDAPQLVFLGTSVVSVTGTAWLGSS